MKVFCVGLGKTGTSTFAECMSRLGFLHRTGPGPYGLLQWRAGNSDALLDLAERYDSLDDYPWPFLYRELAERFPDARFVLTVRRDTDTWLRSLCRHYDRAGSSLETRLAYGHASPYQDPEAHRRMYEEHNRAVEEYFQGSDRLCVLSWDRGDGWPELCGFLGLPTPATSLPHRNAATQKDPGRTLERLVRKGKWDHAEYFTRVHQDDHPELKDRLIELLRPEDVRHPRKSFWKHRLRGKRWIRE